MLYLPSTLQATQVPLLDLGNNAVVSNGISSVAFSWIRAGVGGVLSLAFNSTSQQVVLLSTDPIIFNSTLFQTPVLFSMTVTDSSPQCIAYGTAPMYGTGCSTSFVVSMLALDEIGCPRGVDTVVDSYGNTTQVAAWQEPDLLYFLPLSSTALPHDVFPLGTTSVLYTLAPTVQSVVQSEASRVTCQFDVCNDWLLVSLSILTILIR